jgi:WD40 repeat protein
MTIIIWNLQTGSIINKLQTKHITGIYDLLVINDCETIVSCSGDCTIKIWH